MPKKKQGEKPDWIEKIPHEERRKLLWAAVIIIMIFVVIIWIASFSNNLSKLPNRSSEESKIKQTTNDLSEMLFQAQQQFDQIREEIIPALMEPQQATTTQKLTDEQINLLKQELEKISTSTSTTTPTTTQQ